MSSGLTSPSTFDQLNRGFRDSWFTLPRLIACEVYPPRDHWCTQFTSRTRHKERWRRTCSRGPLEEHQDQSKAACAEYSIQPGLEEAHAAVLQEGCMAEEKKERQFGGLS